MNKQTASKAIAVVCLGVSIVYLLEPTNRWPTGVSGMSEQRSNLSAWLSMLSVVCSLDMSSILFLNVPLKFLIKCLLFCEHTSSLSRFCSGCSLQQSRSPSGYCFRLVKPCASPCSAGWWLPLGWARPFCPCYRERARLFWTLTGHGWCAFLWDWNFLLRVMVIHTLSSPLLLKRKPPEHRPCVAPHPGLSRRASVHIATTWELPQSMTAMTAGTVSQLARGWVEGVRNWVLLWTKKQEVGEKNTSRSATLLVGQQDG